MKHYDWSKEKNAQLIKERGIGFNDVVVAITIGNVLDTIPHPNAKKYPNQKEHIVVINGYAYLVPFVEDNEKYFLKTIIPSRKATKKYIVKK